MEFYRKHNGKITQLKHENRAKYKNIQHNE